MIEAIDGGMLNQPPLTETVPNRPGPAGPGQLSGRSAAMGGPDDPPIKSGEGHDGAVGTRHY
jgi:hypothetical protein